MHSPSVNTVGNGMGRTQGKQFRWLKWDNVCKILIKEWALSQKNLLLRCSNACDDGLCEFRKSGYACARYGGYEKNPPLQNSRSLTYRYLPIRTFIVHWGNHVISIALTSVLGIWPYTQHLFFPRNVRFLSLTLLVPKTVYCHPGNIVQSNSTASSHQKLFRQACSHQTRIMQLPEHI